MAPGKEPSALKRARQSQGEQAADTKKPRRSQRLSSHHVPAQTQLPSPVTRTESTTKEGTEEPPADSQLHSRRIKTPPTSSPIRSNGLSSPPNDTQMFSQLSYPKDNSQTVEDEEGEGVWGYLLPLDYHFGDVLVLRRRTACPMDQDELKGSDGKENVDKTEYEKQERRYEQTKIKGAAAGGYLIGRHPECDRILNIPTISNRHCLIFNETKAGKDIAVLEDLSANGTFINEAIVGRNKRRELYDGDEIAILDKARFIFRYSHSRTSHGFAQQYSIQTQLGKGHFATVYLCIEKNSGMRFAVKKFEKKSGPGERSKVEGLQQEIAVLMGISHPNLLCLKDVFDEDDGVYLILELAVEGELFNWIVLKSKLSETESRKIFVQLFQGLKYLHERNIVHRDIKPENILLVDTEGSIKLADFGLAKIIGEESFTTTLCGTPSYVAPEILESSNHRRYTRAVDVWSAGVVLYICLCGFPPFSDELYSPENPYTLSQQIKLGRFDYPSPYWDPVSDLALDLIDRMLTVDVEQRITIDECLEHPWITGQDPSTAGPPFSSPVFKNATDSTDGLTGAMGQLDFSKRKIHRERTLLSAINDVKLARTVDLRPGAEPLKVYAKNEGDRNRVVQRGSQQNGTGKKAKKGKPTGEPGPAAERDAQEFTQMGGVGDQPLFGNDADSRYVPDEVERTMKEVVEEKNGKKR